MDSDAAEAEAKASKALSSALHDGGVSLRRWMEVNVMNARETRPLPMRSVLLAPLEVGALSTADRFQAVALRADSPDTGRVVRRMTGDVLWDWGLTALVEDVTLCVSELVGNTAHHAVPDGWLAVPGGTRSVTVAFRAWPRWLFVEVSDEDSTPPMLPSGDRLDPELSGGVPEALLPDGGRGLLIVQHLADAVWWAPRDAGGKSVFCRFDLDGHGGR